jgi:hypothetical protein
MNPVPPITTTFIRPFYSAETALRLNLVQARSLHFNRRGTVASCDLRWEQRAVTAIAILTRPTPGAPGRALFPGGDGETLCSKVRSKRSFQARLFLFPQRVDSALPAICEGCSTLALRSPLGDGETQCSKVHSGEAWDGPSLRSQAVGAHCVLALA